jgi:cellulose synthase/poly-beta-1,6-N-acetylglucosamine synthase-like glycosyltransferase
MSEIPLYIFIYIAIYSQVFLIMILLENWETIFEEIGNKKLTYFPKVVIAVPCWNESTTVEKTIKSLLALDYPKEKLEIWVVDDGSTDDTFAKIKRFENKKSHPHIFVSTKENGGKHTVLNYVIENSDSEIFGCLDADSYVWPNTLKNMILKFQEDKDVKAVTPLMVVRKPENILQAMQSVEYNMGLLFRKIFSSMNALHVTPGPFSLFKKEIYPKIGLYKKAHHTEDMEFAFRMQKNFLKIASATDAYVETSTPNTVKKLYKQRLRWTQGFMQNSIDYKDMFLKSKYGNIALFTLPLAWLGIFMVLYMAGFFIYNFLIFIYKKVIQFQAVGFEFNINWSVQDHVNRLFFSTDTISLLAIPLITVGFIFLYMGHRMSLENSRNLRYLIYFVLLWGFLTPLWIAKSLYNTITNRSITWR